MWSPASNKARHLTAECIAYCHGQAEIFCFPSLPRLDGVRGPGNLIPRPGLRTDLDTSELNTAHREILILGLKY
jgi:hypothetical protein